MIFKYNWLIGIVVGLIIGVISYFVINEILIKKRRYNHKAKIIAANRVVLDTLRPFIANDGLPDETILTSIIMSISRQFEIDSAEMYSIGNIYEDLVCEFIANLYISREIKKKNLEDLIKRINEIESINDNCFINNNLNKKNKTSFDIASAVISMLTGSVGMIVPYLATFFAQVTNMEENRSFMGIAIVFLSLLVLCIVAFFVTIITNIKKKHKVKIKRNNHFCDESLRMMNHGTSLYELYDEQMLFTDYFEGDDYDK